MGLSSQSLGYGTDKTNLQQYVLNTMNYYNINSNICY